MVRSSDLDIDFDRSSYLAILRQLTAANPTFAVLGNHDGGRWAKERRGYSDHLEVERLVEDAGINLLHNRSQRVNSVWAYTRRTSDRSIRGSPLRAGYRQEIRRGTSPMGRTADLRLSRSWESGWRAVYVPPRNYHTGYSDNITL